MATLTLTISPTAPNISSSTPLGTVVATLTATRSDLVAFAGNFTFAAPYWDNGAVYAITQPGGAGTTGNLIINPSGPGVGSAGGSIEDVTIVANDPPRNQANLQGDIFAGIEDLALFNLDRVAAVESRMAMLPDVSAAMEAQALRRSDFGAVAEATRIGTSNVFGATELQGTVGIAATNSFGLIENVTILSADGFGLLSTVLQMGLSSDAFGSIESLAMARFDAMALIEGLATRVIDILGSAEAGGVNILLLNAFGLIELRSTMNGDAISWLDLKSSIRSEGIGAAESLGQIEVSSTSNALLELLQTRRRASVGLAESQSSPVYSYRGALEGLVAKLSDILGIAESVSKTQITADALAAIENKGNFAAIAAAAAEALTGHQSDTQGLTEHQALAGLLSNIWALTEHLRSSVLTSDIAGAAEISGRNVGLPAGSASLEFGSTPRLRALGATESSARFAATIEAILDGGSLVLDTSQTSLSIGRVRTITAPYSSVGVTVQPFAPLGAGLRDAFAYDFTPDAGVASITQASWRVGFDPGSSAALDDTPQARVLAVWNPTTVNVINPTTNLLEQYSGIYTVALIGTMPISAIGGVYTLTATVTLSDLRVLQISSSVLCVASQS